ncbi:MAG: SMP-30/gluconolactonase/LRE family protein [Coxiellaceae bacterium]|nr:SMP-30/gluconolactonase/LRE family protein [Coxiellaceae bacterium]
MQLQSLSPVTSLLGESPIWHSAQQCLFWVDIIKPSVHRFDPVTQQHHEWPMPEVIGCIGYRDDNSLWAAMGDGISILHLPDMRVEVVAHVIDMNGSCRMNDGKSDAKGRFWFGSISADLNQPLGEFFCIDVDGTVTKQADGYFIPNGIGWSLDQQYMYHNDSYGRTIYRYRFDLEAGKISQREIFYEEESDSEPDGAAVDRQGNLWVAQWNGARLDCFSPAGEIIQTIKMPMQRPTSCAFNDDFSQLYVTSCSQGSADEEPLSAPAGEVFVIGM